MSGRNPRPGPLGLAANAFQPHALGTARRWRRMRRNELAARIGVTPATVSQYERGQACPSTAVLARLALALGVPAEFFTALTVAPAVGHAHFRSLRATSQADRDQAEAFGELAWRLVQTIEYHLHLPDLTLPALDCPEPAGIAEVEATAVEARTAFDLGDGPVPHMVRLLEAHGVVVLTLPDVDNRVDGFSRRYGTRPFVFANPAKNDKACSRMDAAHELGHLLLHPDTEPGSQIIERQATTFGSQFLAPSHVLRDELPARLDFDRLGELKRRWGIPLKALIYRGHAMGVYRDHTYHRGMDLLAGWGYPEPADLGPREHPALLGTAAIKLAERDITPNTLAHQAALPIGLVQAIFVAGSDPHPKLRLA